MSIFSLGPFLFIILDAERNTERRSGLQGRTNGASQLNNKLPPLDGRISEIDDKDELAEADFSKIENNLKKTKNAAGSPIQVLRSHVAAVLSNTLPVALYLATAMTASIHEGTFVVKFNSELLAEKKREWDQTNIDFNKTWKSSKFIANLITVLASSKTSAQQATKFVSQFRGVSPTLSIIRSTPTASFRAAFDTAKVAAQKKKQTTVIGVSLADVHMIQLASRGQSAGHFSFAHSFAVAIGPEGFVIWQAWGEHGYRLDEWMGRGGDRIRTWDEAEQFVKDFEKLAGSKGPWNSKRNKLYKKLFEVDLNWMCSSQGPEPRCLVPVFEGWVQLEVCEDVKVEDILKFKFEIQREARSLARR
ncbi:uncharacterized protein E2P81_ATG04546 [Venturia nashicola]|nr:uncharacterized protein E2P81_ATG04546 [Venturia nashicola]